MQHGARARWLAALAVFAALAILWTWPLAANLAMRIPHDPGDPILNTWILWWSAHTVPFTPGWWDPPIFYPMPGALALSEHLAGIAIFTTPLQLAGVSAVAAYNVALILSFALSGFFAYLLGRELTGSTLAGLCAGVAYGFAPYRASQLSHLQVLTSQWMPLMLFAMHRYASDGRRRWLALLAAAWLVQAWSNGYYLLFFPILFGLWLLWFVDWRRSPLTGVAIVATWATSSLLLVPSLLHYVQVQHALGLSRTPGEMVRFSAKAESFFSAAGMLKFWPALPSETQESFLFPGVTAVALVIVALGALLLRRRRTNGTSPLLFYAAAAVVMWLLAFGPPPEGARGLALMKPYTLLTFLPGFDGLRVPARFTMLAVLCLSTAAGLAFGRLAPAGRVARTVFAALVLGGLAIDGWMRPMPLEPPPGRLILPDIKPLAVIELPADEGKVGTAAMYRSMMHGRPLINGYSGSTPPHYQILSVALRRHDPSVLVELARRQPLAIVVNDRFDPGGGFRRYVQAMPGIESHGASGAGALFVLPAQPQLRVPPRGPLLPATILAGERDRALVDLGAPRTVRTVEFAVRWRFSELSERMAIDTSLDGKDWATAWEDWTGGLALAGALEAPLQVPVRITLPDPTARYLRVRPVPYWVARELQIYGPR